MLGERRELTTRHGRTAFSILLFQDLSVIPILALIPLLAAGNAHIDGGSWVNAAKTLAMFVVVVLAGRYAIRPIMKRVAAADTPELFTARSEEHTSELQSLMRSPYAVLCLKKKKK